jgi:replicative DNA helicase
MFIDRQLGDFVCAILETGDVARVSTDKKQSPVWLDVVGYMKDTYSTARIIDDLESYLKEFWRALYAQEMLNTASKLAQAALNIDVDGAYEIVRAALDVLPDQENITYSTGTEMGRITAERRKSTFPIKSISTFLPSGFDNRVGKLIYGEIFIIGARPWVNKTACLLQMAKSMAHQKHSVLYCSTETSRDILWARLLLTETEIPLMRIMDPSALNNAELKIYDYKNEELSRIMGAYLMLDDRSRTADDITRQCMRISPDVVIIDHINEMKRPIGRNVVESMWRSDYLKQL